MSWPIFIAAATFRGLALGGAAWFARRYLRALEVRNADLARIGELERRLGLRLGRYSVGYGFKEE